MEVAGKYNVFFGTERGVIGNTQCKPDLKPTFNLKNASKDAEITSMEWGRSRNEIILGQKNGIVRIYNTNELEFIETILSAQLRGEGPIVGAEAMIDKIAIARKSGDISIWNNKVIDNIKIDSKGTLDCMKHNVNRKNIIGIGGEKNDLKIWDIELKKCVFKAKSMGHDNLNLPIPTTIRGITFFESDDKLNACCTREGHLLLYDERVQRRPVTKILKPDSNFTTITSLHKNKQFAIGTSVGAVQIYDFAKPTHPLISFPKFSGGVSSVVCEPFTPLIFSASLDRYLRIHDADSGKLVHSEYLKQGLTKVLVKPAKIDVSLDSDQDDKDDIRMDEEYDKLFDNMEVVLESRKKRKRVMSKKVLKQKKKLKTKLD